MARLDRLGRVKEVAQLAATLGRTFGHELLAAVSPRDDEELRSALTQLVHAELIYRRGLPPDVTYEFKHALVQDAAYQSLLKSTRQHYHQRIAHVLKEQFPEIAESQPELLAHHYTEAGLAEQAIGYWQRAGERAAARSANMETIGHCSKALKLLKTLPPTRERAQKELSLHIALGASQIATKGYASREVERVYTRARELCEEMGETSQLFPVLCGLWMTYSVRGELRNARELGDQLLAAAEHAKDPGLLLESQSALGISLFWLGEIVSAREHLEQGIALYDIEKHGSHALLYGVDPGVGCLTYGAWSLWLLGYPDQALTRAQEALTVASSIAHPFSVARAMNWNAVLHQFRRETKAVQVRAQEASKLSAEQGFPHWLAQARILQGWVLVEQGQVESGIAAMHEALTEYSATGAGVRRAYYLGLLAEAYAKCGKTEKGLALLAEALALIIKKGERWWEADVHRLRGELLLSQGGKDVEAEGCFHQSLEVADGQQAKSLELRAATSLSRLWRDQGKGSEARALLAPIYHWFTEGLDTADLKDAKALLDELA